VPFRQFTDETFLWPLLAVNRRLRHLPDTGDLLFGGGKAQVVAQSGVNGEGTSRQRGTA